MRHLTLPIALLVLLTACGGDTDVSATSPWAGSTPNTTQPLVVALCHGENQTWPESLDQEYFQYLFTETGGSTTIADYWRDISHGRFSIQGSLVLDVQLDIPRDEIGDRDDDDFEKCRNGVNDQFDIDWDVYAGPVVIKPQTTGVTVNDIDADDTEVQVRTEGPSVMNDWPSPPFTLVLTKNGSLWRDRDENIENVLVTAVSKDEATGIATFTIEREQPGYRSEPGDDSRTPPAKGFEAGTTVKDISDIYGSKNRTAVVSVYSGPSTINQELGHFFGFDHSRKLSTSGSAYGDCYDIMSTLSCASTHYFKVPLDYPGGSSSLFSGPGMTAIHLELKDWIDSADVATFCTERMSYDMRALGLPGTRPQHIRVPADMIQISEGDDSELLPIEYISVELRSQRFAWDQGIPSDAFVLHAKGTDGISYLIDHPGTGGTSGMTAGAEYEFVGDPEEPLDDLTFVVDSIGGGTGQITIIDPNWIPGAENDCNSGGVMGTGSDSTTTSEVTTTTTTTPPDALVGAVCVPGTWELNSQAFIDSIAAAAMEEAPFPGELVFVEGTYTMTITEDGGYSAVRQSWMFSIVSQEGTFTLVFDSVETGSVTWDDAGALTYSETTTSSVDDITMIFEAGGIRQEIRPGDLPGGQFPDPQPVSGSGSYTCENDSLVVVPDDSGIEISWTRVG